MALFKCKMCGGTLEISGNETVGTCEYCGTQQTLPRLEDDRRANLYDRANHFRRSNDFDKAMGIYERILNEDTTDAEAYWSLVLCRYGIEYVEDPATHKRIPTVNRAQYTSIFDDDNYKAALRYADGSQSHIYEEEAKTINEIQKGILAISQKEDPFDVFICYKETDQNGRRTMDSVLANDLYHQLTQEGFKVFFSRITLEDKLGIAYEPYIFAALNSARVMVVLGTRPEYFNAVWVRNEWSRYLALIRTNPGKILIPAYRDMDPYDLPEEFSHLQAQDMSKLGFMQDLIRGIKKVAAVSEPRAVPVKENSFSAAPANISPLLKRAFLFLEDEEWDTAIEYCEKVLDMDPECAMAYLGKLMAELFISKQEDLKEHYEPFDEYNNYQKAIRFADPALKETLEGYIDHINTRNENDWMESVYSSAVREMDKANTEIDYSNAADCFESIPEYKDAAALARECLEKAELCKYERVVEAMGRAITEADYKKAAHLFESLNDYRDAVALAQECLQKAEEARKDAILSTSKAWMSRDTISDYHGAIEMLTDISGWKDADEKILFCRTRIEELEALEEARRLEEKRQLEIARQEAAKRARRNKIIACIVAVVIAAGLVIELFVIPNRKYTAAVARMESGNYTEAIAAFEAMAGYKDSASMITECEYRIAARLMETGHYEDAITAFEALADYKDSTVKISECENAILELQYSEALALMAAGEYEPAISAFNALAGFKDSESRGKECSYNLAEERLAAEDIPGAAMAFGAAGDWQDARERRNELWGQIAQQETISAGYNYSAGLRSDGTVRAVGYNDHGQCDVDKWADIVAVSAGTQHTVGLCSDGTVVATGGNGYGQCVVSGWTDIVAVSAGAYYTVGLRSDGTVVAVGYNQQGQCDVQNWTNIVAISAGAYHIVGLRSDGTVVAVGYNRHGQCNVKNWRNIVAISAGEGCTLGLRKDGTIVSAGSNDSGQCNVKSWRGIRLPN